LTILEINMLVSFLGINKFNMKKIINILVLSVFLLPSIAAAHPGRTDSSGCHTCRTNCSKWGLTMGEYHCHRAKTLPQPLEPVKSHYVPTGGYTTPAPEYKVPKVETRKIVVPKNEVITIPRADTSINKEATLVNAVQNMPKSTEAEKMSLFTKLFRLIFGN